MTRQGARDLPAYLVTGDDATVTAQAAAVVVGRLVGEADPALVVEEHGVPGGESLDVGAVVDALATPPFLVERRVVVVRDAGRLTAADAARLADALTDPLGSTTLVLVGGGGVVPQVLVKAVARCGEIVDAAVGRGRDRSRWLAEALTQAPVRLTAPAAALLEAHVGEDVGRLEGLLETLAAGYGEGAQIDEEALSPFLGEAGSVPPWELTDAVDQGDTEGSLRALGRMMGAGGRAAPEVLALLHRHFDQLLRLDGSGVVTPEDAMAALGARSPFVARKALAQSRVLGTDRIAQAIGLLAQADLDVKGRSQLPAPAIMQVLVARLSRLVPASARRRTRAR